MILWIKLVKKPWFWLILIQILLGVYCRVEAAVWYIAYYPTQKWDNLPPLPDSETAKEITEIYVHREIHVVTDQGNSYGCSYNDEKKCWFPIDREIYHYKSRLPWAFGRWYPPPPPGTRQLVAETFYRSDDAGNLSFAALIRADGQVAIWDSNNEVNKPLYAIDFCWGLFFLFLGISVLMLIRSLSKKQRRGKLPVGNRFKPRLS